MEGFPTATHGDISLPLPPAREDETKFHCQRRTAVTPKRPATLSQCSSFLKGGNGGGSLEPENQASKPKTQRGWNCSNILTVHLLRYPAECGQCHHQKSGEGRQDSLKGENPCFGGVTNKPRDAALVWGGEKSYTLLVSH